ncbi:site-2 protease family protein [Massilia sp. CCM 8733]|uniref:Site-2 protease family protein n=1 Tax=Massilia mucilaginosa TaxID=2609282 RepID=A0ABX0NNX2_9BURK|nr:site-2 protease family protein [Massilia mucilaginosa]NHZ88470.1 site-2 protease family protein [Massilia mucilaginosa]
MNSPDALLRTVLMFGIPVLYALALHEAAHGYVARLLGDDSSAKEGRLSLNPLRHIDPFGTILLPMLMYWLIQLPFGYAKPVMIEYDSLREPKIKSMAWVGLAGPAANLAMGVAWAVAGLVLSASGMHNGFLRGMVQVGVSFNAVMIVVNMLPIPPLDGSNVVAGLLPDRVLRALPSFPKDEVPVLPGLLPTRLANWLTWTDVGGVLLFCTLIVLIKLHVLDSFMLKATLMVSSLFSLIASPISFFLHV